MKYVSELRPERVRQDVSRRRREGSRYLCQGIYQTVPAEASGVSRA